MFQKLFSGFGDSRQDSAFLNCPLGFLEFGGFYMLEKYSIMRFRLGESIFVFCKVREGLLSMGDGKEGRHVLSRKF